MKKLLLYIALGLAGVATTTVVIIAATGGFGVNGNDGGNNDIATKYKIYFMVEAVEYADIETAGNELIALPTSPTKPDYVFDGWFFDNGERLTGTYYLNTALTENVVVNARLWRRILRLQRIDEHYAPICRCKPNSNRK